MRLERMVAEIEKKEKKACAEGDYDLAKKYQQQKLQMKKNLQRKQNGKPRKNIIVNKANTKNTKNTKKPAVQDKNLKDKDVEKLTTDEDENLTTDEDVGKSTTDQNIKYADIDDDWEELLFEHDECLEKFNDLKEENGLDHHLTLETAFQLLNSYIRIHKLQPCNDLVEQIFPLCKKRGEGKSFHIKVIQSRALIRYKQHQFKESLQDYIEFRKFAGPSAQLAENMGHVYNTLGNYHDAEKCFKESLHLMELPEANEKSQSNKGGVLLGLGIIKDRLNDSESALKYLYEALNFYKKQFKNMEHSLIAKTLISVAAAHKNNDELEKAEDSYREAIRIFKLTNFNSPVIPNALLNLARCLHESKMPSKADEAKSLLIEAMKLFIRFDYLAIYMQNIIEILTLAKMWAIPPLRDDDPNPLRRLHSQYLAYVPLIISCRTIMQEQKIAENANAGVFFKISGEILMLAGKYQTASPFLRDAIRLLTKVQKEVEGLDVSQIIADCEKILELDFYKKKDKSKKKKEKK